jgi:hypothetical protein
VVRDDLRVCKDRGFLCRPEAVRREPCEGPRVLERHDHSVCQAGKDDPCQRPLYLHLVCKHIKKAVRWWILKDLVFKIEFFPSKKMCIQGVLCAFAKKGCILCTFQL